MTDAGLEAPNFLVYVARLVHSAGAARNPSTNLFTSALFFAGGGGGPSPASAVAHGLPLLAA